MRRSILGVLLGVVLSTIGFFVATRGIQEPPRVVNIWPIGAGVGAMLVAWLAHGASIAFLARRQLGRVPLLQTTRVYLATQAVGGVTPFAGGEVAYQLLELRRLGIPADLGGAIITIKSAFNGLLLFAGAAIGLLIVPAIPFVGGERTLPFPGAGVLLVGVLGIVVAWLLIIFLVRRRRSSGSSSDGRDLRQKARDFFRQYKKSLVILWRENPWAIAACGGLMAANWAVYPLLGVFALLASGWSGDQLLPVFVAQYVLFVVIPLAPTPGNSGAAEIAFVAVMGVYVPQAALLGGVLIWRVLNHYSELILGAFLAGDSLWEDLKIAREEFGSSG